MPSEAKPPKPNKPGLWKTLRKWVLRGTGVLLIFLSIPVILLMNPGLLYAHHSVHGRFTVYHHTPLDPAFRDRLDNIVDELDTCEIADPRLRIDICLHDGSKYPALLAQFFTPTFAQSFSNKMVLRGRVDWSANTASFPETKWNLEQLITHEAVHSLQLWKFGVWTAMFHRPTWKWEGYAEYAPRRHPDQLDLAASIRRLRETEKQRAFIGRVKFADGSDVDVPYYNYWLLVQYGLDVKNMTYVQLMEDTATSAMLHSEMMQWYADRLID